MFFIKIKKKLPPLFEHNTSLERTLKKQITYKKAKQPVKDGKQ